MAIDLSNVNFLIWYFLKNIISGSVGGWDWSSLVDSTDSCSISNTDLDVTVITPCWSPWVLDDDIVTGGGISSPSDGKDTVIKLGSTSSTCKNTTSVLLESSLVSFDSDWNWSSSKSCFKLVWLVWSNIGIWSDGNYTFSLFIVTEASEEFFAWLVWPGGFSHEWVGLNIVESEVHKSTIATAVLCGTVDKVCFWKRDKVSCGKMMSTFKRTSWWESPAWSALTLILNWGNSSCGSPVNSTVDGGFVK